MSDIVMGDTIEWIEPVWNGYSPGLGGRRSRQAQPIGERSIRATVLRESYGATTGQHTFSLLVLSAAGCQAPEVGKVIRRMGRNLYSKLVDHIRAGDAGWQTRADDKHQRGAAARHARDERMMRP